MLCPIVIHSRKTSFWTIKAKINLINKIKFLKSVSSLLRFSATIRIYQNQYSTCSLVSCKHNTSKSSLWASWSAENPCNFSNALNPLTFQDKSLTKFVFRERGGGLIVLGLYAIQSFWGFLWARTVHVSVWTVVVLISSDCATMLTTSEDTFLFVLEGLKSDKKHT